MPAAAVANKFVEALGVSPATLQDSLLRFILVGTTCFALSALSWYCWETKWLLLKGRFVAGRSAKLPILTPEPVS
jgi:hypothetical protein